MKKSSHWYSSTGTPCHEVPNASKPGTKRPTTIRDARTLKLFPSVTTILGILDKPQLNDWKLEQMTKEFIRRLAILETRPPADAIHGILDLTHRELDVVHDEIVERAFQQVEDAADAGTQIHRGCELTFQGQPCDESEPVFLPELNERFPLKTFLEPIRAFMEEHNIRPSGHEVKIVNLRHGYAGTGDLPMTCSNGLGFGDFKTRKTKPGKPVRAYDPQVMQIAAYHNGHYSMLARPDDFICGWNLFVSTTEPGRVEAVWYTAIEICKAWDAFVCACGLWRFMSGYDPRQEPRTPASGFAPHTNT